MLVHFTMGKLVGLKWFKLPKSFKRVYRHPPGDTGCTDSEPVVYLAEVHDGAASQERKQDGKDIKEGDGDKMEGSDFVTGQMQLTLHKKQFCVTKFCRKSFLFVMSGVRLN